MKIYWRSCVSCKFLNPFLSDLEQSLTIQKETNQELDNKYRTIQTSNEQIKSEKEILQQEIQKLTIEKENLNSSLNSAPVSPKAANNNEVNPNSIQDSTQIEQLQSELNRLKNDLKCEKQMKVSAINKLTEIMSKKDSNLNPNYANNNDSSSKFGSSSSSSSKNKDKVSREKLRRKEKELAKSEADYKQSLHDYEMLEKKFKEVKNEKDEKIHELQRELDKERKLNDEKLKNLQSTAMGYPIGMQSPMGAGKGDNKQQQGGLGLGSTDNLLVSGFSFI